MTAVIGSGTAVRAGTEPENCTFFEFREGGHFREYSLQVIETEQVARQSPVPLTCWPVAPSAMDLSNYLKTNK